MSTGSLGWQFPCYSGKVDNKAVADWLNKKYIEWVQETGKRQTVTAFAQYCGVRLTDMSRYLSGGRRVEGKNLKKIGEVLGFEIYDLLGRPRPDPKLQAIIDHWGSVSEDARDEASAIIQRAAERGAAQPDRSHVARANRK